MIGTPEDYTGEEPLPEQQTTLGNMFDAVQNALSSLKGSGIKPQDLERMIFEQFGTRVPRMQKEGPNLLAPPPGIRMAAEVGRDAEGLGRLAIGGLAEGIARTGASWKAAMSLIEAGYEPSDPEVLKYAFDVAINMMPAGIAIKEGSRLAGRAAQAAPDAPGKPTVGDIGPGDLKMTKPGPWTPGEQAPSASGAQDAPRFFQNVDNDWVLTGKGVIDGSSTHQTLNFGDDLDALTEHVKNLKKYKDMEPGVIHTDNIGNQSINYWKSESGKYHIEHGPKNSADTKQFETSRLDEFLAMKINLDKDAMAGASSKLGSGPLPHNVQLTQVGEDWVAKGDELKPFWPLGMINFGSGPTAKAEAENFLSQFKPKEAKKVVDSLTENQKKLMGDLEGSLANLKASKDQPMYHTTITADASNGDIMLTTWRPKADGTVEYLPFSFSSDSPPDPAFVKWAYQQADEANKKMGYAAQKPFDPKRTTVEQKGSTYVHTDPYGKKTYFGTHEEAQAYDFTKSSKSHFGAPEADKFFTPVNDTAWYHDVSVANTNNFLQDTNLGSFAVYNLKDKPEFALSLKKAYDTGVGKMFFNEPSGTSWVVDLRPKNMRTEPFTKLEAKFPGGTRIDTIPVNRDAAHPGPLFAYHGTGERFRPTKTAKGEAEFEFADPAVVSSDIGWHFGTAEQASRMAMNKAAHTGRSEGRVIPTYLDVKTPFTMNDHGGWYPGNMTEDMVQRLRDQLMLQPDSPRLKFQLKKAEKLHEEVTDLAGGLRQEIPEAYQKIREWLDKHGYDSIRYLNEAEGEGWSYIVWQKGKVKSASTPDHTLYSAPSWPGGFDPRERSDGSDQSPDRTTSNGGDSRRGAGGRSRRTTDTSSDDPRGLGSYP